MLAQVNTTVLSPLQFLLSAGGLPLLAFGIVFSLWGLWNMFRSQNQAAILSQLFLSLIPGVINRDLMMVRTTENNVNVALRACGSRNRSQRLGCYATRGTRMIGR